MTPLSQSARTRQHDRAKASQSSPKTRVPQQDRAKEKVKRIIAAGIQCFNTHGYARTTMARIAQKAGVSTGTVYAYFSDKDDVLSHIMQIHIENIMAPAEEYLRTLPPKASARDVLLALLKKDTIADNVELHRVFHDRMQKDDRFKAIAATFQARALDIGRELVRRFGHTCATKDIDAAAEVVIALLEHCTHAGFVKPSAVSHAQTVRVGVDMIDAYFRL